MSSIIASSEPSPPTPTTGRGVLSSSSMPIDCASRRAGSMVSTTTFRPRSAARSASAADVVVLPTPPEPQQTMMPVSGSSISAFTSSAGCAWSAPRAGPLEGVTGSCHALVLQAAGQLVEAAHVDAGGQPGQLVRRDAQPLDQACAGHPPAPGGSRGRGPRRATRPAGSSDTSTPAETRSEPIAARSSSPLRAAVTSLTRRSRGRTWLTTTPPTGSPASRRCAIPSAVSWTGISSSTVTKCTAVRGERNSVIIVSACFLIGPTLASPASSSLTLRNGVIRPVGGASSTTASYSIAPLLRLLRCTASKTFPVSSTSRTPGRDRGRELDDPEPVQGPAGAAELVVHREVLQQRGLGVDVQRVHDPGPARRSGDRSRSGVRRTATGRRRTSGRCPAGPRPRTAARACPARPAPARAPRRRSTCRCRPCRSPRAGARRASRCSRANSMESAPMRPVLGRTTTVRRWDLGPWSAALARRRP